jgi:hypothetical protein
MRGLQRPGDSEMGEDGRISSITETNIRNVRVSGMRVRSCCGEEKAPLELGMNYWGTGAIT